MNKIIISLIYPFLSALLVQITQELRCNFQARWKGSFLCRKHERAPQQTFNTHASQNNAFTQEMTRLLKPMACGCALLVGLLSFDAVAYTASPNSASKVFGIMYSTWHCPFSGSTPPDISKILAREAGATWILPNDPGANRGPINAFHWWGMPDNGYYCLTSNTAVLTKHAQQLRDAGIDFVFIDMTNHPNMTADRTNEMIKQPFEQLLTVWSNIPGAPKVVPWVRVIEATPDSVGDDTIEYVTQQLTGDTMAFLANGKPAVLVAPEEGPTPSHPNNSLYANSKLAQYANRLTLQKMWTVGSDDWNYLTNCANNELFKLAKGNDECNQATSADGVHISVSAAYQVNWMSDTVHAISKFGGRTLLRQLETAGESPASFVTITGWNEWIAQRLQINVPSFYISDFAFTDLYDKEYSRDLEPGGGMGSLYYEFLKRGIAALKSGNNPYDLIGGPNNYWNSQITGVIDGVGLNSPKTITGWACAYGTPSPIDVHLYAGGPAGQGVIVRGITANIASESAVASACGSWGTAYRFRIPLTQSILQAHQGKYIYIHGIHPTGPYPNSTIGNSGVFTFPAP